MTKQLTEQYTSQNFLLCVTMGYHWSITSSPMVKTEVCTHNGVLLDFLSEETGCTSITCAISSVPASIPTLSDRRLLGQMMV